MVEARYRSWADCSQEAQNYVYGHYDLLVIGAGHAGCEAAYAAAKLGRSTLLLGMNLDSLANLPCNPSIGGTAKGQLVREIDALGGLMGEVADLACIQFRMLNRSKGPAVLSPRAQVDRRLYSSLMKERLEACPNLELRQEEVTDLLFDSEGRVCGALGRFGALYGARRIVLATGTYLRSRIVIGERTHESGPDNLFPSKLLAESLAAAGVGLQRFKTGTPVRVNLRQVDCSLLERQEADSEPLCFSFRHEDGRLCRPLRQRPCYLAWTNPQTHQLIRENQQRSPLFTGLIEGVGPRYCPSIEDKVRRFAERERHQIFVEPMSEGGYEMYLQGLSTSLPQDVQLGILGSIAGLEGARIQRSAYAIEYDCLAPGELRRSLELRRLPGVYTAGQLNGSSGYEEAAAQGLLAGLNASLSLDGRPPIILTRDQAYIGVLIDDLVTKGTQEPYRMMTSRAEYRLLLRQDNADLRLSPLAIELGLLDEKQAQRFRKKSEQISAELQRLRKLRILPSEANQACLAALGSSPLRGGLGMTELLQRPELNYQNLAPLDPERPELPISVQEEVNIQLKYEGYIRMEEERLASYRRLEARPIPEDFDYRQLRGLRLEAQEKLARLRPETLAQAAQISGVSPADISVLLVQLRAQASGTEQGRED